MSLLLKINKLNNFTDRENFLDLFCKGIHVGLVHKKIAELILNSKLPYELKGKSVFFTETKKILLNITTKNTCNLLLEKKIISKVTGENFPCVSSLGNKELFKLERTLVEFLGIRGYGVHLIAYVRSGKKRKLKFGYL